MEEIKRTFEVELVFDHKDDPRTSRPDLAPLMSVILSHSADLAGVETRVREVVVVEDAPNR